MSGDGKRSGKFRERLALIITFALAARIAWVIVARHIALRGDGFFYFHLADALSRGKGFLNAHEFAATGQVVASANHTPAWPLVLSLPQFVGMHSVLTAQIVAALVGSATVAIMGSAGRHIAGPRVGLIAAAVSAVYPNFWVYEHELMSETLALLLTASVVIVAYRLARGPRVSTAAILGGLAGLLILTHPNYVLLVPLLCVPLIWLTPQTRRQRVAMLGAAIAVASVVVAPWVAFNATRFSEPVYLTTAVGLTLVDGNCPTTYYGPRLGSWGVLCSLPPPKGLDAAATDQVLRRRAEKYIGKHLDRLPVVFLAREGRTLSLFRPLQQTQFDAKIGSPLWVERLRLASYVLCVVAAAVGFVALRKRKVTLVPLGALGVLVVVTVAGSFGDTRYRAPAEIAIVLLAAVGIDRIIPARSE